MLVGKIVKGIAGFYYVDVAGSGIYECRARGIFRKDGRKPLVGDLAGIEITHEADREGNLVELLPRKNELFRPAAANVDQALVLFAIHSPDPNLMLLDRFLIAMEQQRVPSAVCFNKTDLSTDAERQMLEVAYEKSGVRLFFTCVETGEGLSEVREYLKGKTTLLAGPSGVGKSSLTNACQDGVRMETGEISRKLLRGKNTTRHAQLIPAGEGTYLMDTPGFTFLETRDLEKERLRFFYPEFGPFEGSCRFDGCTHIHEPDCKVREALSEGKISGIRYENYVRIYDDLAEQERRRY